jgi:hypothetical protein
VFHPKALPRDISVLAHERVRFRRERVGAVAADTPEQAELAASAGDVI